jgi:alkyl sulfatase BDS1-like metallo-beta-lactamase superfamily hydrolase
MGHQQVSNILGRLGGLLLISALALQGCDSSEEAAPESAVASGDKKEPLFQPHDWHPATKDLDGFGAEYGEAIEIVEGIYQSRATSNVTMIATDDGNIIIDTGIPAMPGKPSPHRAKLDRVNDKPTSHIILTHAHADHYGGTDEWIEDGTEIIVQREFLHNQHYLKDLTPFFYPRNKTFFPEDIPDIPSIALGAAKRFFPIVDATMVVDSDPYEFTAGGQQFVVYHTPGAEGNDNISLWMPEKRILLTGDLFGHMFGMWPNLTTIRGERARFTRPYIDSLNLILALKPEIMIPSHFYPIKGADYIKRITTKTRDAVAYVDDAVIEGMNDGKDMYTLMREIKLPEELQLFEAHGRVSWGVKSIWKAYTGWFEMKSANEMYDVPVTDAYPEIFELAGGGKALMGRADTLLAEGELEKALYLTEIVESVEPDNADNNKLMSAILNAMRTRANHENHYEDMFLNGLILETNARL